MSWGWEWVKSLEDTKPTIFVYDYVFCIINIKHENSRHSDSLIALSRRLAGRSDFLVLQRGLQQLRLCGPTGAPLPTNQRGQLLRMQNLVEGPMPRMLQRILLQ